MSSTKVTELTAASSLVANDLLMVIKDTSSTPVNKKITISDVANSVLSNVNNHIVPAANNTTNLGSAVKSFNTAYLSSNGIVVNGTRITIDNTGTLTVNGAQIISSSNVQLANNATYAYGKTENNLNVNSAVYAATVNNATYAYGKIESALNVNSAITSNTSNNATYLGGKTEGGLNVNSAVTAINANNSTFAYSKAESALNVNSALSSNNSTFAYSKAESALNVNSAVSSNNSTFAYGKAENALNVNSAATATSANNALNLNSKPESELSVNTALTSNNTTFVNGKAESALNVNSALTSNNTTFVNSKAESALNVNSALSSNNTTHVNGKTEANLNVNNAVFANNSSFLNGKAEFALDVNSALSANNSNRLNSKLESALNVNSALTSNNTTYVNGKLESGLNVNSSLVSNNSTFAYGKTQAALNVNNALTSNNASFLDGVAAANYALLADPSFTGIVNVTDLVVANTLTVTGSSFIINATAIDIQDKNITIAKGSANSLVADGAGITVDGANALITYVAASDTWNFNKDVVVGNTSVNATINSTAFTGRSNNSLYLNGKSESALNVNNALTANNSAYLNSKLEAGLNVNSAASALTSNNSTFAFGKAETALNVNSALTANNSSNLNGKSEANLNVNNAVTSNTAVNANNSTYLNSKSESGLNVNSALTSNNSSYLNGKLEAELSVNTSLTSNNSTYAYGKNEVQLNVNAAAFANDAAYLNGKVETEINANSALVSNNSTFAYGKAESALNVNNATTAYGKLETALNVNSALTSNNSTNLNGVAAASYVQNTDSRTLSGNITFTANVTLKGLIANGSLGTTGQFLSSNGSDVYWGSGAVGGNAEIQFSSDNALASDPEFTYDGDTLTVGNTAGPVFIARKGEMAVTNGDSWGDFVSANNARFWADPDYVELAKITSTNSDYVALSTVTAGDAVLEIKTSNTGFAGYRGLEVHKFDIRRIGVGNVSLRFPSHEYANSYTITLPGSAPANGEILISDNSGNLSWTSLSTLAGDTPYTWTNTHIYVQNGANSVINSTAVSWLSNTTFNGLRVTSTGINFSGVGNSSFTANAYTVVNTTTSQLASRYLTATANLETYSSSQTSVAMVGAVFTDSSSTRKAELFTNSSASMVVVGNSTVNSVITDTSVSLGANSSTTGIFLSSNGNVGLGNTTPVHKLRVAGSVSIRDGIHANNSLGSNGQVLMSNGSVVFWSDTANNAAFLGGSVAANYVQNTDSRTLSGNLTFSGANTTFGANVTINGSLNANDVVISGNLTINGTTTTVNAVSLDVTDKNITVAKGSVSGAAADGAGLTVEGANALITYTNATDSWNFNKNIIVGNSSVNATINSTAFTGLALTANNTTYVNGKTEGNLNVNNALTANLASYIIANTGIVSNADGVFVNSAYIATISANNTTYVNSKLEANLNVNNALTANLASYIVANSGLVSNADGVFVNTAYIGTLSANNTTYVNGKQEANLNVNTALTANLASYIVANSGLVSNAEGVFVNTAYIGTLTANNTTYVNGKLEANLNVNNALTSNLASYIVANTGLVSNADGVFVNTAYIGTLSANNTTYVNGKQESALNVNSALTSNSATYLGSKTEAQLDVNTALTSNSATYLGSKTEAQLDVNTALTANSSTYLGSVAANGYMQTKYVINPKTDDYTVEGDDTGTIITVANTTSANITIPDSLDIGFNFDVINLGSGNVVIANATGVTLLSKNSYTIAVGGKATVIVYAANSVSISGDVI